MSKRSICPDCAQAVAARRLQPVPEDKHTGREDVKRMIETAESISPNAKKLMMSALFHPERNNLCCRPKIDFSAPCSSTAL